MITATIIDDEPNCCEILATLIERYCPEIKVLDLCYSAQTALDSVRSHPPQIVFLDIEMPYLNGFELLEKLDSISFKLIFTTSYDQYAIKAIRFSALDYLLKPIGREELQNAVRKAIKQMSDDIPQQIKLLLEKLRKPAGKVHKIAIPTLEGLHMVFIESIVSCGANSNYTVLNLKDKQKIVASKTLKEIEELLEDYSFLRVHHSWLVNLNEIERYIKGEGGYLIMADGSIVDVSRSRKESMLARLRSDKW